jgi:molybdopterin-guanine dinucleotide biosynthesis protein A
MLSIIIQAGGKSRRMGEDKALMPFLGEPLINRLVSKFADLGDELLVITNRPEAYRFLELPLYTDVIPERGALGGLYTALEISSGTAVGLIACDMPFASPELIDGCRSILQEKDLDAVIPTDEEGLQPLHAVYRRETCLPMVKSAIDQDQWKMISWHEHAEVLYLSPQRTRQLAGTRHTFLNLNTPEQYREAEKLARRLAERTD